MNQQSLVNQLSFISTIISHAKVCTEMAQPSDDWNPSAEMVIQAAAVLDKIPHVQDEQLAGNNEQLTMSS